MVALGSAGAARLPVEFQTMIRLSASAEVA